VEAGRAFSSGDKNMENVQALLERPRLYDNIDGSSELMLGCMMIGFTVFALVGAHARQDSIWNKVYMLYIFVALLVVALIYGRRALKSAVTYRRTGFVRYRKPDPWWLGLIAFLAASAAFGLSLLIIRRESIDSTVLVTVGMGLFWSAAYANGFARATRWKWAVAALFLITAIVIAMLPDQLASAPMSQPWLPSAFNRRLLGSVFWYEASCGLILLVSGFITLALYLRRTRQADSQ
jgi:hypothetical protein